MKLNIHKSNFGYFTPAGTVVLLALWLAFLLGMWYVASKIINWLNRMFPQPPPICQPTNIVDVITHPGVWIQTDDMIAGVTKPPPSSDTPSQVPDTPCFHNFEVVRSDDLQTWVPLFDVRCTVVDMSNTLNSLMMDEAMFWPSSKGFYHATAYTNSVETKQNRTTE